MTTAEAEALIRLSIADRPGRPRRASRAGTPGGRIGRTVRRGARGRLGVHRTLRAHRDAAVRLPSPAPRAARVRGARPVRGRDDPRPRRGDGARRRCSTRSAYPPGCRSRSTATRTRAGQPLSEAFAVVAGRGRGRSRPASTAAPCRRARRGPAPRTTSRASPASPTPTAARSGTAPPTRGTATRPTTSASCPAGSTPAWRTSEGAAASAPTTSPRWPRASPDDGSPSYPTCGQMEHMTSRISHTTVDCHDAHAQSVWWAQVLGMQQDPRDPNEPGHEECMIFSRDGRTRLLFIEVPDEKQVKNRIHLDLRPTRPHAERGGRAGRRARGDRGRRPAYAAGPRLGRARRSRGQRVLHPAQRPRDP